MSYAVMPLPDWQAALDAVREKTGETGGIKSGELADIITAMGTVREASAAYSQMNAIVGRYIAEVVYDPADYTSSQIAAYVGLAADYDKAKPLGAEVEIPAGTLVVMDPQAGTVTAEETEAGAKTVYNLTPGENASGYLVLAGGKVKQCGRLNPSGQVRMINCETVNVRDLGGWACDGGTVKYGKLYRGGEFKTADAEIFLKQLGIRHELNLRGSSEAEEYYNTYLTGDDIILRNVIRSTCPEKYVWYTITDTYADTWKEILRCIFDCVKYGEPLFFHCSAGADRTGTVACIIEALLGMSQSDIDKDYELTCFYSGVESDSAARRRNEGEWSGLISQINALAAGSTFRDKVVSWVVSLGFTVEEINAFRKAMIDGTPENVTVSAASVPVTWRNGYVCDYTVGNPINVRSSASYIVSEEIPVEYGKTYSFSWNCPSGSASFYWVGTDDNDVVTEQYKCVPGAAGTFQAEWTPTAQNTTKLRFRGYSTAADSFTAVTELIIS